MNRVAGDPDPEEQREDACYLALVFKLRASRRSPMEGAREVFVEDVDALEVNAGPPRPMQDWVGLPRTRGVARATARSPRPGRPG